MKIAFSNDHAGLASRSLLEVIKELGHDVVDYGTDKSESVDYPDMAAPAVRALAEGKADRALLVCGSGVGMSIAANRIPGVRCVLAVDEYSAEMSRLHNDSNCLALRSREQSPKLNENILRLWLQTAYEGGRHQQRVDKLEEMPSLCQRADI